MSNQVNYLDIKPMTTAQIRAMTGDEMEARHLEIHEATKKRQLATPSGYSCCDRCDIYYFVEDSYKYPIKGNRFFLYCVDCTKELLATKGSIAQPRQTIEPEYTQSELDSEIKRQKSIAVQAVARHEARGKGPTIWRSDDGR